MTTSSYIYKIMNEQLDKEDHDIVYNFIKAFMRLDRTFEFPVIQLVRFLKAMNEYSPRSKELLRQSLLSSSK